MTVFIGGQLDGKQIDVAHRAPSYRVAKKQALSITDVDISRSRGVAASMSVEFEHYVRMTICGTDTYILSDLSIEEAVRMLVMHYVTKGLRR